KKPARKRLNLLGEYPASIHKAVQGVDICEDHPMFEKFRIRPLTQSLWDSDDVGIEMIRESDTWSMLPDLVIQRYSKELVALDNPIGWDAPYFVGFIILSHRVENSFLNFLRTELHEQFR